MKFLKYLLLIVLLVNFSYSISFDELIKSYDFTYKSSFVEVNLNELNNITINTIGGKYIINNYLSSDLNTSISKSENIILNNGDNHYIFLINNSHLESGNYSAAFEVISGSRIIFRNDSLFNLNIKNNYSLKVVSHTNNSIQFNQNLSHYNSSLILIETENGFSYVNSLINQDKVKFNLPSNKLIKIKKVILSNTQNFIISTNIIIKNELVAKSVINQTSEIDLTLSDLSISNFSYNNLTGESVLNISNEGIGDAIYFDLKLIDDNYNFVFGKRISYLLSNTSLSYVFNLTSNLSNVYVFIDYYNSVNELDEENNLFVWPIKEKVVFNLTQKVIYDKIKDKHGIKREFKINESLRGKVLNLTYDFSEKKAKLKFLDFNTTSNLNKTIKIDLYENAGKYLTVLGVNSSYNFSNVSITLSYNRSLVKNESKLRLMYCSKYNYDARNCDSSFVDISNRAKFNFSSGKVEFITSSFSAYAITEYEEEIITSSTSKKSSSNNFDKIIEEENTFENISQNNESQIKDDTEDKINIDIGMKTDVRESNLFTEDNSIYEFFDSLKVEGRPSNPITGNIIANSEFGWFKLSVGVAIISVLVFVFA